MKDKYIKLLKKMPLVCEWMDETVHVWLKGYGEDNYDM